MSRALAQIEPDQTPARKSPLGGGLSLLILVALALQLPTLHVALEGQAAGRDWSPWRLVAQPIIIREARAAHKQREIPTAAARSRVNSRAVPGSTQAGGIAGASAQRRLCTHLLDLPPPVHAAA